MSASAAGNAALLSEGMALYNRGRFSSALRRFRRGRARGDSRPELLLFAAYCLRSLNDRDGAGAVLADLRQEHPCYTPAVQAQALLRRERFTALALRGRLDSAFSIAEEILDVGPTIEDTRAFWNPWGWDLVPAAKRALLRRLDALARRAPSPWADYHRGPLRGGKKERSIMARMLLAPRPRYGWMLSRSGLSLLMRGRFNQAVSHFREALRSKPRDWKSLAYLAEARLCLGQKRRARRDMTAALAESPKGEKAQALAWQGEHWLWEGRYDRALRALERARVMGSLLAPTWKGAALLKLGRRSQALACLEQSVRANPLDAEAQVWLGEALRELGRHREALAALSRKPILFWARVNRALAFSALGRSADLLREFERIPKPLRARLLRGGRARVSARAARSALDRAVRRAKGFRREDYFQRVWMP